MIILDRINRFIEGTELNKGRRRFGVSLVAIAGSLFINSEKDPTQLQAEGFSVPTMGIDEFLELSIPEEFANLRGRIEFSDTGPGEPILHLSGLHELPRVGQEEGNLLLQAIYEVPSDTVARRALDLEADSGDMSTIRDGLKLSHGIPDNYEINMQGGNGDQFTYINVDLNNTPIYDGDPPALVVRLDTPADDRNVTVIIFHKPVFDRTTQQHLAKVEYFSGVPHTSFDETSRRPENTIQPDFVYMLTPS